MIVEADGWPALDYKYGEARAPIVHLFLFRSLLLPFSSSILPPMALIRRFSSKEKGKAPREGPNPLPSKKRLVPGRCDEVARPEMSRPWYERPPPGFPLPLYARAEGPEEGDIERRRPRRRRG